MKTAVCPGSFDPITNGHMDIIRRAAGLFDRVIVLVAHNYEKKYVFSPEERRGMLERCIAAEGLRNVEVEIHGGLLVDFVRQSGASAIVKGLRAVSDFEYEFQMALANRSLLPQCETLFLTTGQQHMYLSSSLVRQVAAFGGDISKFVPQPVLSDIQKKFDKNSVI